MSDDYYAELTLDRPPHEVYSAVNRVRDWWMADILGTNDHVGEEFSYHVAGKHYCKMRVTELVPDRKIVWTVVESEMTFVADANEWVGTALTFEFVPTATGTELRFTHVGLVPQIECFDICFSAWQHYIGESLRSNLTTGFGLPNSNPDESSDPDESHDPATPKHEVNA